MQDNLLYGLRISDYDIQDVRFGKLLINILVKRGQFRVKELKFSKRKAWFTKVLQCVSKKKKIVSRSFRLFCIWVKKCHVTKSYFFFPSIDKLTKNAIVPTIYFKQI